jgi:uncharacterized membrane protein (UPF0127 family)
MKQVTFILLTCFLWLAGASAALPENAQISKLETVALESADAVTEFTAEVADTEELRTRGLMFRHFLPEDKAMLFDYEQPRPVAMWMKNTNISLDMLFIREDGTIAAIAQDTVPRSLDTISVQEPVRGVLELAAGTVKKLGLRVNDKVYHRIFTTAED